MKAMERRINEEKIKSMLARFKAANIVLDEELFIEKLVNLETNTLSNTLRKMADGDKKHMLESIKGFNVPANIIDPKASEKDLKQDVKKKLNLSDITEFENNNKGYFKFKDKDGNITLARNMGDNARDLFLNLLNDSSVASKKDGRENAAEIFNFLKEKKLIEVEANSSKHIESSKESKKDKAIVKEMQKHFPGKEIIYSSMEHIYIVKGNNDEDDLIIGVNEKDGKLKINQIKQKGYEENNDAKQVESPSITEEGLLDSLANDETIKEIIISNNNNDISDEITINQVKDHVSQKYPQYRNSVLLIAAISNLINRTKQEKLNNGNQTSLGRQYVLRSNQNIMPFNTDDVA